MGQGKLTAIVMALALSLGLAACSGGGGSSGGPDPETERTAIVTAIQAARDAAGGLGEGSIDADVAAAEAAVEEAREAITDATALSEEERDGYGVTIELIEALLGPARMRIGAARLAEARSLLSAFESGPRIDGIQATVRHGATPMLSGTVLGAPPKPIGIETAIVPGSGRVFGGWAGGNYTASDDTAGTVDTVAFQTDIEAPTARPFSGEGGRYMLADDGSLPIGTDTNATLIASPSFPTSAGIRTHEPDGEGLAQVLGTFDGAEGIYVCPAAGGSPCTSSLKHGGGIALEGGRDGWKFLPVPGADVAEPDASYRYFGWWLRRSGGAYFIGTFHAGVGDAAEEFFRLAALQGPASYRGPAVGMFAIADENAGSLGRFAATARLTARFGDGIDFGTVTGTIDGFTVNGEAMPWTVDLGAAGIGADGSIAATEADAARTVWSIGDEPGAAPGGPPPTWEGQFHEASEDRVPMAATGTFEAGRGDNARMIGAFGATLQEQ